MSRDIKQDIEKALNHFGEVDFFTAAINLFTVLGYNTSLCAPFPEKTFAYLEKIAKEAIGRFSRENALVSDWKQIDLLFQVTTETISSQGFTIENHKVILEGKGIQIESYVFFAIELAQDNYSRSALVRISREINKVFAMPVLVVFRYGQKITLSVVSRRLHKREESRKVLEKVTLIKDIAYLRPHRAHIDIFFDLSFPQLKKVHNFTNFVELHNAWQKTLDTKELNKRFYRDLSNWYFWALKEVQFPTANALADQNQLTSDAEKIKEHNAKSLIRLLTRLLFVWFIKEKNLIPEELFDEKYIKDNLLKEFEPGKRNELDSRTRGSRYYRAILQNLFFATLNQTVGKRAFRKEKHNMNVTNLMRYESYFKNPQAFIELVENVVPFMNGGLFESLDVPDPSKKGKKGGDVILYEDGFSDRVDNVLSVPDYIFFGVNEHVDLSEELGDSKQKDVTVLGLIHILKGYKFTVTENTPIEEDIALDPELLGRVFENLLASYNPETRTTARNQTGSFYTPREIVDYMVEASLKEYLSQRLTASFPTLARKELEGKLEDLLGYNESANPFSAEQTKKLIQAIDTLKIIDPAVGSGAFPMGILHKLVHLLHKLDPDNKLWLDVQRQKAIQETEEAFKIGNKEERDNRLKDISEVFENNSDDYGRKLYLIENCIYGVDIQPVAIQISKLRFFISLVIDQKTDKGKENFAIRALPNLETKFVAANTLIGLQKPDGFLRDPEVDRIEEELKKVRHGLFSARTPAGKRALREEDKKLREEMSQILEKAGMSTKSSRQLAAWDPYNQNTSSGWFDAEWMFGLTEGFDIVIGNPPYVQLQKDGGALAKLYEKCNYTSFERTGDIYALFYENGMHSLRDSGHLCFITSNKWMRAAYGKSLRKFFTMVNPVLLIDLGPGIFENATVDTNIFLIQKTANAKKLQAVTLTQDIVKTGLHEFIHQNKTHIALSSDDVLFIGSNAELSLKAKIEKLGKPLKEWDVNIYFGIKTGLNEAFIIDQETRDRLIAEDPKSEKILKPILRGRDIDRYGYTWAGLWVIATFPALKININNYPSIKKYLLQFGKDRLSQEGKTLSDGTKSRKKTGNKWFETQDQIGYYDEFEKEKVVWIELVDNGRFAYVKPGVYIEATGFVMITPYTKYFIGILNSLLINWFFDAICASSGMGTNRWKKIYVEQLPVPPITAKNKKIVLQIEKKVEQILAMKEAGSADTKKHEAEIDQLVYKLYDLTEDEIAIIEGSVK